MDTFSKHGYLSPATGTLDISVVRDARPYTVISLDLGIPNFTVFSIKFPLVEDKSNSMSELVAEAVHTLLDEMSAFMIAVGYNQDVIVGIYAAVLVCFKGLTGEADTNKSMSPISKDPTVKTFEGTFKIPMAFINETYDKVVTASINPPKDITKTPAFKAWFAGSKIVNSDGTPMKMYHGTGESFDIFNSNWKGRGMHFFTPNPDVASSYAEDAGSSIEYEEDEEAQGAIVMPVYLSVKHPFNPLNREDIEKLILVSPQDYAFLRNRTWHPNTDDILETEGDVEALKTAGFDGLIGYERGEMTVGVWNSNQIKSAIGNNGAFNPEDNRITAAGKKIKRPPVHRHLELTYDKPTKTTVDDARTVIRNFRGRSLKTQPGPLFLIVYDQMGNAKASIPMGGVFKNQLLQQLYKKKGSVEIEFSPTVKFDNDIEMKTTNAEGIPKSIFVGDEQYTPVATISDDMALYSSEQDEYVVKFPDGRCVAFTNKPSIEELRDGNYPVPTVYPDWVVLSKDAVPDSSDRAEAVDERGVEVIEPTETESNPVSDLKADDDKNEQLEEGVDDMPEGVEKTSARKKRITYGQRGRCGRCGMPIIVRIITEQGRPERTWVHIKGMSALCKGFKPHEQAYPTTEEGRQEETSKSANTDEKGYWAGAGNGASGILPICTKTGRICLAWRNKQVHQGDSWGTIGGGIKRGKSPADSAKMELAEETGYTGSIRLIPAFVFIDGKFKYYNYLGLVPVEFDLKPMEGGSSGLDFSDETDALEWLTWDELQQDIEHNSGSYHFGLLKLFQESGDQIQKICQAVSNKSSEA